MLFAKESKGAPVTRHMICTCDSKRQMKGTRATTPAAYEFNYEKDHFVFSNVDFALTFGIPNVDSRIHITLHPIPLKLLVNNSSKRPAFVFPNIDFALMFGIPNADSVSTSHFTYSAENY